MQMDDRKRRILRAIIDDYILTGIPVGSRTISKKYETGLSSATIRKNWDSLISRMCPPGVFLPPRRTGFMWIHCCSRA